MTFDFIEHRENQNISPIKIENKQKYYVDLLNIEESTTGRVDALVSNTFIQEAVQLIINSIVLFEKGYFDCSFYSMRQSLEVSTTMIYLVDNSEESRSEELKKWKSQSKFPMYSQMMQLLEKNKSVFFDIKSKLSDFFEDINATKRTLNKYVHKQGFNTFYSTRNGFLSNLDDQTKEKLLQEYEGHLQVSIGAVAVFRLSIDPFPVMLNDEEIYLRTGDFITRGYDDDFISNYIGFDNLEKYKQTEVYQDIYHSIMENERMNPYVAEVVKNQFVNRDHIDKILEQKDLLSTRDFMAVSLFCISSKISKVYCLGGLQWYFSTTDSKRSKMSWNSLEFKAFEESVENYNMTYDEVFISTLILSDDCYFIEHNEKFDEMDILLIEGISSSI